MICIEEENEEEIYSNDGSDKETKRRLKKLTK